MPLGWLLLIPLLAAGRPTAPQVLPAIGVQQAADTLVGTIGTLDLSTNKVTIITGVGLALRSVPFLITTETRATAAGAAITMSELRSGDVVRVIGGRRPEGRVAYVIDRLPPPPSHLSRPQ